MITEPMPNSLCRLVTKASDDWKGIPKIPTGPKSQTAAHLLCKLPDIKKIILIHH